MIANFCAEGAIRSLLFPRAPGDGPARKKAGRRSFSFQTDELLEIQPQLAAATRRGTDDEKLPA